jgi:hypothetical protein
MFETSGTTEVMERSPWLKYLLSFAGGSFVTILIFNIFLIPSAKRVAARSAEKAAQQKFSAELAKNPVEAQLTSAQASLQTATQERDECKARFDRLTILYDNTIPVDPDKIWIIPADIEPIAVGDHHVTYTHYDLKTKRETAHFYPRRQ